MKVMFCSGILGLSLMALITETHAVGKLSRSCRFDRIGTNEVKAIAASFLQEMGAPSEFAGIDLWPPSQQGRYWIHESLTTDYFSVRYYLFAKSNVYLRSPDGTQLGQVLSYRSRYSVQEIKNEIKSNPKFSPAYANRGPAPWYSARAGDPRIFTRWGMSDNPDTPAPIGSTMVVGRHFYVDAANGAVIDYGESRAVDCNLGNWGFGLFDR